MNLIIGGSSGLGNALANYFAEDSKTIIVSRKNTKNAKENIDYNVDDISYIWHTTTLADTRIIENNHKGLMSRSFEPGVLSKTETGITYFYNWYFNCMNVSR